MRTMLMKVNGEDVELGPCDTRGAMHYVKMSDAARTVYLANQPDTNLVTLHGDELQVRAAFIRNAPDWKIIGPAPVRVPVESAPTNDEKVRDVLTSGLDRELNGGDDEAPEPDMTPKTYDEMSKAELQAQCETAGVSKSGSKADLIERLIAQADANESVE